ncbi:DUF1801 domain-containing protein [Rubellicoccus peritrichatus]|uniref:DUF1801 domain-containing protein n=1 Tax=Rubellicoccus peritrichatus TaxID=3080537 RepID=A0AAQ3LDP7_9BACT|nr:DUF1801 domain-containing protein [Puniceicoccus sp. CR14]WOO41995.1 DUF1801 domain-containing protein [Puniceicoccus sp. CR14]
MYEPKTKQNDASVAQFLESVEDPEQRHDCEVLLLLMQELTGEEPKMWGKAIIGFGHYDYKTRSGCRGGWFLTGFSPRKKSLSIHIMTGFDDYGHLMEKMGKYKNGVSCLYVKRLSDVDLDVLKKLITLSVSEMRKRDHMAGC